MTRQYLHRTAPPRVGYSAEWIRAPVVAGSWYPDDPDRLAAQIDGWLDAITPRPGEPLAIIVPHAGYYYSGAVAAHAFKQLAGRDYSVAVIVAADHQPPISRPVSVWAKGGFATPLGVARVNETLAAALLATEPGLHFDPAAHADEHPIEIEIPFLQRVCPDCPIIPILMGTDSPDVVDALSAALTRTLADERAVIIASSDLSHYPSAVDARRIDQATLAAIETGDVAYLRATLAAHSAAGIPNLATPACSAGPIQVAMQVAANWGADGGSVLHYANSGDVDWSTRQRVVGYGAVMFARPAPLTLDKTQRQALLAQARAAIAAYLADQAPPPVPADPTLSQPAGVFVTLRRRAGPSQPMGADLRGCIGHIEADQPLVNVTAAMAVSAASQDWRFPPVEAAELAQLRIEISVLSPLRRIHSPAQIEIGRHGLVVAQAGRRGLLLPEVAAGRQWDARTFLEQTCLKAGLSREAWRQGAALYTFTTLEFGES